MGWSLRLGIFGVSFFIGFVFLGSGGVGRDGKDRLIERHENVEVKCGESRMKLIGDQQRQEFRHLHPNSM